MEIDWIHRPSAPGAADGTLNLCFNALDRHVVHGRADEAALLDGRELTFARLLEDVAAFGGVLRAFGVGPGDQVVARMSANRAALVAALASARVGALHVIEPAPDDGSGVVVLSGTDDQPRAVIRKDAPEPHDDLDWDVLLRAGRADPAPSVEVPATAPAYVADGRTLSALDVLEGRASGWPFEAIAALAAGESVRMTA